MKSKPRPGPWFGQGNRYVLAFDSEVTRWILVIRDGDGHWRIAPYK